MTHQFVREDALEEASSVSQHDEEESLRLLSQVMHPPTDLDPLVTVLQGVTNLDLKEDGTCTHIYMYMCRDSWTSYTWSDVESSFMWLKETYAFIYETT